MEREHATALQQVQHELAEARALANRHKRSFKDAQEDADRNHRLMHAAEHRSMELRKQLSSMVGKEELATLRTCYAVLCGAVLCCAVLYCVVLC